MTPDNFSRAEIDISVHIEKDYMVLVHSYDTYLRDLQRTGGQIYLWRDY